MTKNRLCFFSGKVEILPALMMEILAWYRDTRIQVVQTLGKIERPGIQCLFMLARTRVRLCHLNIYVASAMVVFPYRG